MSEVKTAVIGETTYVLKLFPAMDGWDIRNKILERARMGQSPDAQLMCEIIVKGAGIGSTSFDEKKINKHFAGKLGDMDALVQEICVYNFPEFSEALEGPNVESGSTED